MWIIYSVVLHILLLGSIFVIYFRSPVITGLQPQFPSHNIQPPAKRLVLFVTDGLRAESFFHDNCADIPNLKKLILNVDNSLVGVSHTRVPTESRPGHIALIAGLYEDPSAVTRGWKENPIGFDTVFNRSRKTYAWGANDVLHIFSRLTKDDEDRMFFDSYSHELDFSGKEKTYELDQWVFQRVKKLLARKYQELKQEEQTIFFLHLLGLDTAGHVHKPGTDLFLENLLYTEKEITRMYDLFEATFQDEKTVYVLTSDHGMTNAGSHGAGGKYETETPFFIWGAGVNSKPYDTNEQYQLDGNISRPLYRVEQAQMAPLMSALLGIATPMNNFGILPHEFLNASIEYRFQATHNNALQLVEQYKRLLQQHEQGWLASFLPKYSTDIGELQETIENQANAKSFSNALKGTNDLMRAALHGIEYYFGYYRWLLLLATAATIIGFLAQLISLLVVDYRVPKRSKQTARGNEMLMLGLGLLVLSFCMLQKLALVVSFYLLLPVAVWYYFIVSKRGNFCIIFNTKQVLLLVTCSELLVYTFFERRAISLGFLLFTLFEKIQKEAYRNKAKFLLELLQIVALSVFPLLPISVGYSNNGLLLLGIFLTIVRSHIVKNAISIWDRLIIYTTLANACICIYMHSQQMGIFLISQLISWAYLVYVLVSLLRSLKLSLKHRLERMIFLLTSLYSMFCTSYEALFILLLLTELISSIDDDKSLFNYSTINSYSSHSVQLSQSFRYAFVMILYTFFSFFGTGNIASVSSFDPNIIRCFLTTFSPFVIMILVIIKLIIPLLLIMSSIFALSPFALKNEKSIFICLLIICDVMGLNFLFLVKNQGSWLEIGSSISHFVIIQVTTVVLALFVYLSKYLLKIHVARSNLPNHLIEEPMGKMK
ncbi:phosphatidylinositol glycan anchor biosynthesis class N [Haematobia irritans]|uniref:phosphatidylinositol glycan anchor biosynthesis class N n=1 Tax=Haematobia irritans TaxID=7368 RepID=UPI003F4FAD29